VVRDAVVTTSAAAPGFFGKLPSHGDFVGRRLPASMRDPFDAWLQRGIVASRGELGAAWHEVWSSSPLWRFILAPGLCGAEAWSGVMMPSMDRVGRCFPLVLAAPSREPPALADCLGQAMHWFTRLEDIALSALEAEASLDALDAALLALGPLPVTPAHGQLPPSAGWPRCVGLDRVGVPTMAFEDLAGDSAWWGHGSEQVQPALARCRGLPAAAGATALLNGAWRRHGWEVVLPA